MSSLAKLGYWAVDYIVGYYLTIRPALARSTLVLFDRYLVDALIDPRRYRYGGPRWALEALWWAIPKPDLVVLLDAPTHVLRDRKQELPAEEIDRLRRATARWWRSCPPVTRWTQPSHWTRWSDRWSGWS